MWPSVSSLHRPRRRQNKPRPPRRAAAPRPVAPMPRKARRARFCRRRLCPPRHQRHHPRQFHAIHRRRRRAFGLAGSRLRRRGRRHRHLRARRPSTSDATNRHLRQRPRIGRPRLGHQNPLQRPPPRATTPRAIRGPRAIRQLNHPAMTSGRRATTTRRAPMRCPRGRSYPIRRLRRHPSSASRPSPFRPTASLASSSRRRFRANRHASRIPCVPA